MNDGNYYIHSISSLDYLQLIQQGTEAISKGIEAISNTDPAIALLSGIAFVFLVITAIGTVILKKRKKKTVENIKYEEGVNEGNI